MGVEFTSTRIIDYLSMVPIGQTIGGGACTKRRLLIIHAVVAVSILLRAIRIQYPHVEEERYCAPQCDRSRKCPPTDVTV